MDGHPCPKLLSSTDCFAICVPCVFLHRQAWRWLRVELGPYGTQFVSSQSHRSSSIDRLSDTHTQTQVICSWFLMICKHNRRPCRSLFVSPSLFLVAARMCSLLGLLNMPLRCLVVDSGANKVAGEWMRNPYSFAWEVHIAAQLDLEHSGGCVQNLGMSLCLVFPKQTSGNNPISGSPLVCQTKANYVVLLHTIVWGSIFWTHPSGSQRWSTVKTARQEHVALF